MTEMMDHVVYRWYKVIILLVMVSLAVIAVGLIVGAIADVISNDDGKHQTLDMVSDTMLKLGMWNAAICMMILMGAFLVYSITTSMES